MIRTATTVAAIGLAAALAAAPAFAEEARPAPPVIGPNVSTFTLANGLEAVVIPDHRAPVVTHMVWYKVGAMDETPGKTGIAHFLEHLMFKGTEAHPEGEFSKVIADNGGNENAFTASDYTAYFQRVAKEHLGLMMEFEADRMANLRLTDDKVLPERQVILEERSMRLDNEPSAILSTSMDAVLYLQHPYGVPIIGWREDMEGLDREDAIAFYDRYYTPNNAILVVAGDVEPDEVRALAEATYGKLPRRVEPVRPEHPRPGLIETPRFVEFADPRVKEENILLKWVVPSVTTGEPGTSEALDVLSEVLGGGSSSRLYRQLVVEKKVATAAGAYYRGSSRGDASFTVYAVPAPGVTLETLRGAILDVLAETAKSGVGADEVVRAGQRLLAGAIYAQDNQATLARIFGSALAIGQTVEDVQQWPARIEAVTAEAVNAAAGRLDPARSVTGYLRVPADLRG